MIVKTHETKNGVIVAVVDKDILGQKFEENDLQLDLASNYYKGELKTIDEVGDLIRNAYGVNIVGEQSIRLAIEEGIITEEMIKKIKNIPYYQGTSDLI
ncbi:DUF424 family protein [Candidatus Woesearchaeota archaeon]|nr:DUF424 family protein [Candidatus Woesearchaeota archaeon]